VCLVLFSVVYNGVPPCLLLLLVVSSLPIGKHEDDAWCSVFRLLHSISSLTVIRCRRTMRLFVVCLIESDIRTFNRRLYTHRGVFDYPLPSSGYTLKRAKRFAQLSHELALFFRIQRVRKPKQFLVYLVYY